MLQTIVNESHPKRVKHVVSSGEVPHLWFHSTQGTARNSTGSLYFNGDTIYSYGSHFPIAKHVSSKPKMHGERAVLFTTRKRSITTSGHCSAVRSAIPSNIQVFKVPNVDLVENVGPQTRSGRKKQHTDNLTYYRESLVSALAQCARARSSWAKEWEHKQATELREECKAYCKFFRIAVPKLPTVPALDSAEMEQIKRREAKQTAKKAEQTKREREEQAKHDAERAERWRNGENVGYFYGRPVMLRLRNSQTTMDSEQPGSSPDVVETSLGAQVPVSHALRGLRFVRAVVSKGEAYQRNGHTLHLGHYAIDRIDVDGTLHAGCHVISLAEIERLAPSLESLSVQDVQS